MAQEVADNGKRLADLENLYEGTTQDQLEKLDERVGTLQMATRDVFNNHAEKLAETNVELGKVKAQVSAHNDKFDEHNYAIQVVHKVAVESAKLADSLHNTISKPSQSTVQVTSEIDQVNCKEDSDFIAQHETRNMEKVTKNATVPEDVREQISAAIDHVERIMQEQLPTDYQHFQPIAAK